MAGVWSGAWGQELKAEVGARVQGVGAWGRGRNKRAGCRGRERGQLMGRGGGLWGKVREQGQEASADSRDPWGCRHRGKDSLLWHWKGPLPQPSSLEGREPSGP